MFCEVEERREGEQCSVRLRSGRGGGQCSVRRRSGEK